MSEPYFPDANEWERSDPETVGLDPDAVAGVVNHHAAAERCVIDLHIYIGPTHTDYR